MMGREKGTERVGWTRWDGQSGASSMLRKVRREENEGGDERPGENKTERKRGTKEKLSGRRRGTGTERRKALILMISQSVIYVF